MSVQSVSTNIIPNNDVEIIKDFKAGIQKVGKNAIGTATDVKNKVLDGKNVIGTATDTGKQIVEKTKEMKAKSLGIWNVLKKSGIMLGAALGAFAGLVAAGTITVTLPVSLPILGALAGGLFLGGSIAALIHNIKDPTVHGAGEIFKGTLKDIGMNMLLAVPTLISYIMNPQQANEDIKSFSGTIKQMSNDLQKDAEDLKSILENSGTQFKLETQKQLENLQSYLQQYQTAVANLSGNSTPEDIKNLEKIKNNISGIVTTLKDKQETLKNLKANKDRSYSDVLDSLDKTFSNEKLNETFRKLNDSFSKKSKEKNDKEVNVSNIKSDIENDKSPENDASSSDFVFDLDNESIHNDLGKSVIDILQASEEDKDNWKLKNSAGNLFIGHQKKEDYIKTRVVQNLMQKNEWNNSIVQIIEAYNKVEWSKLSQKNSLQTDAVSGIRKRMQTMEKNTNNAEVLQGNYSAMLALVNALHEYNSDDNNLTELKNALENFEIPSSPFATVNESKRDFDLNNSYHALGEPLISSTIEYFL